MSVITCTACGVVAMGGSCSQCGQLLCDPCQLDHDCRAPAARRIAVPLDQETAATTLYHAARRYASVAADIPSSHATPEQLHLHQTTLEGAALAYARAHGWRAPI
ncbi:MAG TPA: hypothetical protein VFE37_28510 [Chloroflexota bacterium]|nr:hypothetical protein [Chloroflexota bacterium]